MMSRGTRASRVALAFVFLYSMMVSSVVQAGAYIHAGEGNGLDVINHPSGYTGTGGVLNVGVCIDPDSLNAEQLVIPIKNNIAVWNDLQPVASNVQYNVLPSGYLDAESVLLHEVGHCIGLAHVNAASESGLSVNDYTKATDGANNVFDVAPGPDGVVGSYDDVRGDDVNLHWFNPANDPFQLPIHTPVDTTQYKRDTSNLPFGDSFAQNASRSVAAAQGYPTSEAVMQQGSYYRETQRELVSDDASTIMLAASGVDERAGTGDDYQLVLTYEGITTGSNCDITVIMRAMSGLAYCSVGGYYINGTDHVRVSGASIHLGAGYNYVFNTELRGGGSGNQPPVAGNDNASVDEDNSVSIAVLGNDSDPDGDTPTISAVGNPPHGSAVQVGNAIEYSPDANYNGADSFAYTITDGKGGSDSATVNVTVNPVNDLPVANDDNGITTAYETAVDIDVLDNDSDVDGDILSVAVVGNGTNGVVTIAGGGSYVTYQPNSGFSGDDAFTYTAADGTPGSTDEATVTVTVDAPFVAGPDYAAADLSTPQGSVSSNDYLATHAADGSMEAITESHTGGKPSDRADSLEHIWQFNLTGGNHVFNVDATADFPSGDMDSEFRFQWSTSSSGGWAPLVAVTGSSGPQSVDIGSGVSGTVYVRVVDINQVQGNTVYSTVSVDHMYFDASEPTTEPPEPPGTSDPTRLVVGSIVLNTVNASKGSKYGQAVVTVTDDVGNVISGVTVSGTFTGTYSESGSDSTDGSGTASLTTAGQAKKGIAFSFCVDSISQAGSLAYAPDSPDCAAY
jgi:hypothetical protein